MLFVCFDSLKLLLNKKIHASTVTFLDALEEVKLHLLFMFIYVIRVY